MDKIKLIAKIKSGRIVNGQGLREQGDEEVSSLVDEYEEKDKEKIRKVTEERQNELIEDPTRKDVALRLVILQEKCLQ